MRSFRRFVGFALLAVGAPLAAQTTPPAAPAAEPAATVAPTVSLEQAYQREYALLETQKRDLAARLAAVRGELQRDQRRLEGEVTALENRLVASRGRADALAEELARTELARESQSETRDLLEATYTQARTSLSEAGDDSLADETFAQADDAMRLQRMFERASARIAALSSVRREPGRFYLADGTEVAGEIVRLGNVAAYGISAQGSGALAPAGGGRYRLWNQPAADAAQGFASGRPPAVLPLYVYETLANAASEPEVKTFWGEMEKGGAIGYVIMALGAVALVLIVLRAIFLKRAGASIHRIMDAVSPALRQHKVDAAIEACKRFKGSAARVVTATLRNLDRDREHLEDIISESILHESTHLNRFAGVITMIAGVAPLLGLLGTVTGMIQTFDILTEFGNADPKLLSSGIATALVTTEQGLIVAIPCLLFGNLLSGWADGIKDDMEKAALKVINLHQDVQLGLPRAA